MPELPEVETVRSGLAPVLEGATIHDVTLHRADLRFPFPPAFAADLKARKITKLQRRAKYLLTYLDNDRIWITHLGMTGALTIRAQASPLQTHDHMVMTVGDRILTYNDPRRFGFMDLINADDWAAHKYFKHLGPEPLADEFSADYLINICCNKTQSIKQTLMDQRVVVGVGNIYACEALYRAGINPTRAAGALSRKRLGVLTAAVKDIIADAIQAGGSTLRDYRKSDGSPGLFQHRFCVYGRENDLCPKCANTVLEKPCIRRIVQGGRSTFYCHRTQR